jgi:hypothetical protein
MSFADDYVERLEPWLTPDLETYLRAICEMFGEVELLAFETDDTEAWEILFDADRIPAKGLPYLAQYLGERLPEGISEPLAREWLNDNPNRYRGTPYSIFRAAQRHLTGDRLVLMSERDNGTGPNTDPETLLVRTLVSQTPSLAQTEADIQSVLPADVILDYDALPGQTYGDVDAAFASYTALDAAYGSYAEMASDTPAWPSLFSRPVPS